MEFGEKIQKLRNQNKWTQEQLAEKLYVSRTAISKWESGKGYPNIDSLKDIAKLFNKTIDELLSSEEIIDIAKKIDTYETSILPYEDCCTVFVPKHPVINPKESIAINEENKFDYNALIDEAIENIQTIRLRTGRKYEVFKKEELF